MNIGKDINLGAVLSQMRLLILLPVVTCFGFISPAYAGKVTGELKVSVRSTIAITKTSDLNFGSFIPGTTDSEFRVVPKSNEIINNGGNAISVSGNVTSASFNVSGMPLMSAAINPVNKSVNIVRDGGTETMLVDRFTYANWLGLRYQTLNPSGKATYYVGGSIRMKANQAPGTYRGQFTVTIDYY